MCLACPHAMSDVISADPREMDHKEGNNIVLNGREQPGGHAASVLSAIALKGYTIGMLISPKFAAFSQGKNLLLEFGMLAHSSSCQFRY